MGDPLDDAVSTLKDPNRAVLSDPRVKDFLNRIGKSEGADYNTLVGGRKINDLSRHPNKVGLVTGAGPSTAFGKYQIVGSTDRSKLRKYRGLDYSPENQDLRAVELLRQTGALDDILSDRPDRAVVKAGREWASLPGSPLPGRKNTTAFQQDPLNDAVKTLKPLQEGDPLSDAVNQLQTKPEPTFAGAQPKGRVIQPRPQPQNVSSIPMLGSLSRARGQIKRGNVTQREPELTRYNFNLTPQELSRQAADEIKRGEQAQRQQQATHQVSSSQGPDMQAEAEEARRRATPAGRLGAAATRLGTSLIKNTPVVSAIGPLVPTDMAESFAGNVVGALADTVKQGAQVAKYGSAMSLLPSYREGAEKLAEQSRSVSAGTRGELERLPPASRSREFVRTLAGGAGRAAVELPKLMAGGALLKAAELPAALNLPIQGALSRADEGREGIIKGAAGGLVYHFGGSVTGPYLGRLGNTLLWVGAPAAEAHLVNGVPWDKAIAESLPMGAFAGFSGAERAQVNDKGTIRDATIRDIPRVAKGELKIVPPAQPAQRTMPELPEISGAPKEIVDARERAVRGSVNTEGVDRGVESVPGRGLEQDTSKAVTRGEKVNRAGFTETQAKSLAGDLKDYVRQQLEDTHRKGQAGGVDVDLLTLGVRPFAKDVAAKGREVAAGTRVISDGIKSLLAPPSRSEQALQTSRVVRANAAAMARAHDIADRSLSAARKFFGKQRPESNYDFIDKMERGERQSDPNTQKFADTFRQMLDERRDQIRALGTGKLESFIEDYFPHIWKDPKKARDAFAQSGSKRPFEGSKSFLKKRTLPLTSDGLALGLEPASNNPVDLAVLKLREMDKYLMAHKVMNEMKEQGNLKFFKVSERLPDGWKQIDDKVATVFSRGEKGELILRGRYAAPEPAARIVNNYLSPGLNATMFRVPFKAWRASSNLLNQFQLGFSAFHAGFTTVDAIVSRTAIGLEDIVRGRGVQRLRGLATIASTPASPVTNLIQGSKMLKEWYQPGSQGTEIGRLVQSMQEGGGRARMDQFYTNNTAQKFMDTLRQGNLIGAAIRAPGASVELLSKPVMEWLVPRQKMGVFADMAKRELERLGPDATEAQRRHVMAKAWDSVDNRMGQLVYDNLFWNKTLKDLSMASVRSVGWNIGTLREIGGGLYDTANLLNKGMAKARGKKTDPLFTHRMAYTAALPLVVGTMGAITQYLLTGKKPEELKDYFFPKTGAVDENGNPERISFPSYMKDVFHAVEEPGKVVTNKLHPLAGLISEMLRNEDYYGTKIRNEDDPLVRQLKDIALHVGQSALPFSIRGYQKETERGGSLVKRALPFVGITPAPSYINKSRAEKLISKKTEAILPRGARTREQADRSRLRHELQAKARNGQDIKNDVDVDIKQGKLKPDDANDILRDAKQTPLQLRYKRLPLKDALEVWDVMTPNERADVKDILAGKAESVDDLPETEQEEVKKKMDSIGLKPGTVPRRPREQRQPRKPRKPLGSGYVFQ